MMNINQEKEIREKRRDLLIKCLKEFLPEGKELQYDGYLYSELLMAMRDVCTTEIERINDQIRDKLWQIV